MNSLKVVFVSLGLMIAAAPLANAVENIILTSGNNAVLSCASGEIDVPGFGCVDPSNPGNRPPLNNM